MQPASMPVFLSYGLDQFRLFYGYFCRDGGSCGWGSWTKSQSCRISQNLAHPLACLPRGLSPQLFQLFYEGRPDDRLKCLKSSLEMEEFSYSLHSEREPFKGLLKEFSSFQFLNPTTKLPPVTMAVRSKSPISSASTAQSLHSSPQPSSPHRLLPHTHTCPLLLSSPKLSPIATHSPPLRKLILVGYLNTPKPPLPHRYHQFCTVRAAQQFPPETESISSSMASFLGIWTSVWWPRPSWQLWLRPVPNTPFEVTKSEYLAPAKTKLAGQTFSSCGQQQTFLESRPSCPSLELPHPITFDPHKARLWSLPALT